MQKIYYNKEKNFTIIDVSGIKPLSKIKKEFGDVSEAIEIDETKETYELTNRKLSKKTIEIPDNSEEQLIQKEIRKIATDSLKLQGKISI